MMRDLIFGLIIFFGIITMVGFTLYQVFETRTVNSIIKLYKEKK